MVRFPGMPPRGAEDPKWTVAAARTTSVIDALWGGVGSVAGDAAEAVELKKELLSWGTSSPVFVVLPVERQLEVVGLKGTKPARLPACEILPTRITLPYGTGLVTVPAGWVFGQLTPHDHHRVRGPASGAPEAGLIASA
ncbi:hypothetical protein GCM10027445_37270 [Amycolatopsis endophytica]